MRWKHIALAVAALAVLGLVLYGPNVWERIVGVSHGEPGSFLNPIPIEELRVETLDFRSACENGDTGRGSVPFSVVHLPINPATYDYFADFGLNQSATTTRFKLPKSATFASSDSPRFILSAKEGAMPAFARRSPFLYESKGRIYVGVYGSFGYACAGSAPQMVAPMITADGFWFDTSMKEAGTIGAVRKIYESRPANEITDSGIHYVGKSTQYIAGNRHVYHVRSVGGNIFGDGDMQIRQLIGADLATFRVIAENQSVEGLPPTISIALDAHTAYVNGDNIPGVDIATFEVVDISVPVTKDKNFVYARHTRVGDANPHTFRMYDERLFTDDTRYWAVKVSDDGTKTLMPIDYEALSIKLVPQSEEISGDLYGYTKDTSRVYYRSDDVSAPRRAVEGADVGTFVQIAGLIGEGIDSQFVYAKDDRHVYYKGMPLKSADPKTFRVIENGPFRHFYGKDTMHVFYGARQILGADPATFEVLWRQSYVGCYDSLYEKDARHVYLEEKIVPNADPETFQSLVGPDGNYGKDARGYYQETRFLGPTIDPSKLGCNDG